MRAITRTSGAPIGVRMRGKEDVEPFLLARDEGMTVGEAADFAGVERKTGRAWSAFGFTWRGRGRRATAGFLAIWKNNAFETEKTPVWHENARRGSKADSFAAQYATYSVKPSINLVIGARLSVEFVPKREKDGRGGAKFSKKGFRRRVSAYRSAAARRFGRTLTRRSRPGRRFDCVLTRRNTAARRFGPAFRLGVAGGSLYRPKGA